MFGMSKYWMGLCITKAVHIRDRRGVPVLVFPPLVYFVEVLISVAILIPSIGSDRALGSWPSVILSTPWTWLPVAASSACASFRV